LTPGGHNCDGRCLVGGGVTHAIKTSARTYETAVDKTGDAYEKAVDKAGETYEQAVDKTGEQIAKIGGALIFSYAALYYYGDYLVPLILFGGGGYYILQSAN